MGLPLDNTIKPNTMGPVGAAAVGTGAGIVDNIFDLAFGKMKQKQQLKGQKEALAQQNEAQLDLWNKTNYEAQMAHMKSAGLNPALLYGMGGAGGGTTGSASAMPSPQGGQGMDIAGAAQLALIKAQTENIQADTANKQANTTKTAGVDTELGKGQIANLAQQTKNAETQNEIMQIDKRVKALQEGILDATQYYEMGKVQEEWNKITSEARSAAAKANVDQNTAEELIKQETIRTAGMLIENRARAKGIELTDAQIDKILTDIDLGYKEAETHRWDAETNAKNAATNVTKSLKEAGVDVSADEIVQIILGLGAAAQFGKGGYNKPQIKVPRTQRYNKWGTQTAPKSRGGFDLK